MTLDWAEPMTPLKPVTPGLRTMLGVAFFVLFIGAWAVATLGGFVSKTFRADPIRSVANLEPGDQLALDPGHQRKEAHQQVDEREALDQGDVHAVDH